MEPHEVTKVCMDKKDYYRLRRKADQVSKVKKLVSLSTPHLRKGEIEEAREYILKASRILRATR